MGRAFEYRKARKLKRWGHMARVFTKIHKKLGEYELDVHWKSTKKRIGILGASGSGRV